MWVGSSVALPRVLLFWIRGGVVLLNDKERIDNALVDLARTIELPPYEGVDVAWVSLIKVANIFPGSSEHRRLEYLLELVSTEALIVVLDSESVDKLLTLDPPLESVLATPHERLDPRRTAEALQVIRDQRKVDPKAAAFSLAYVLKRIRNRRAHGFKTPSGPRDNEILLASVQILRDLCNAAAAAAQQSLRLPEDCGGDQGTGQD